MNPTRKSPAKLLAGKTGRQLHQSANACRNFHIFKRILFGNRITGNAAILDVEFNGFTDVCQGLLSTISLGGTPRQYRAETTKPPSDSRSSTTVYFIEPNVPKAPAYRIGSKRICECLLPSLPRISGTSGSPGAVSFPCARICGRSKPFIRMT
jgi:hypothetical protein